MSSGSPNAWHLPSKFSVPLSTVGLSCGLSTAVFPPAGCSHNEVPCFPAESSALDI